MIRRRHRLHDDDSTNETVETGVDNIQNRVYYMIMLGGITISKHLTKLEDSEPLATTLAATSTTFYK